MGAPMETLPADTLSLGLFVLAVLTLAGGSGYWLMRAAATARAPHSDGELAIYRDQIAEVERDLRDGRLSPMAADAALLEVGRRLTRAEARAADEAPARTGMSALLVLLAAGVITFGAGGLYLWRGTLMADQPFASRKAAILQASPEDLGDDEVIVLLQEQAKAQPDDPRPHLMLGQVLVSQDRDNEALRAFQAALRRDPRNVDAMAELGALFARTAEGGISAQADEAFAAALAIDPNHGLTRHYQALGLWQAGNRDAAWQAWRTAWTRLSGSQRAQLDLAGRVFDVVSALDRGPQGDLPQAGMPGGMAQMTPEQRSAAITGMIDQRAARLAAAPTDLALRLSVVRVQAMVGNGPGARSTLQDGLNRARGDGFALALLATAGALTGLGVPDPQSGQLPGAPAAP
jgi:cytochrome c-type biogenesis protein CcmH